VLQEGVPKQFPIDPLTVTRGVLEILWEKLDPGRVREIPEPSARVAQVFFKAPDGATELTWLSGRTIS
jgi:hypothetical protein